jgi:Z1 domain
VADFHDLGRTWQDEEPTVENSNESAHVRKLEGDPLLDPAKRDEELTEALDAFVLSGAVKLYRQTVAGRSFKHHTMLVHESVRQNDHRETADAVRRLWAGAAYGTARSVRRLRKLWDVDFSPVCLARSAGEAVPPAFDDLIPFLGQAVALITTDSDPVIVINSDKDIQQNQKKLDFDAERVWRILVGGAQLSRGFTVQDLTVSYFRRKSLQADTLMQAGRWFGFRPGYRDLVRLYIRSDTRVDLYGAFEALLMDEEAFRDELRRFEGLDEDGRPQLEPWQIPPLVSQHLPWLRPTARSKMWNAVIDQKGVGGRASDLYNVPPQEDVDDKVHNFEAVGLPLLHATTRETSLLGEDGRSFRARVGTLPASDLMKLLARDEGIRWHPDYERHFDPIRRSLEIRTAAGKITDWVVVWPQVSRHPFTRLDQFEYEVPIVQRSRRSGRTDFVGSDSKHRYAVERIAGLQRPGAPDDPVVDELRSATRGGLLVYLVDDRLDQAGQRAGQLTDPGALVVLLSITEPVASVPAAGGIIRWAANRRPQLQGVASVPRVPAP